MIKMIMNIIASLLVIFGLIIVLTDKGELAGIASVGIALPIIIIGIVIFMIAFFIKSKNSIIPQSK